MQRLSVEWWPGLCEECQGLLGFSMYFEGSWGLGLRRLEDSNKVFGLKLIWLLFASTGSLWVAWVKQHLIAGRLFWTADFQNTGSSLRFGED